MSEIKDFKTKLKVDKVTEVKHPQNVTAEKFNDWVYRLWVTSPSSLTMTEFYQKFREYLWEMYISQEAADEAASTNNP